MEDIKRFNKILAQKYGSDLLGRARYRVIINSPMYTEKRKYQDILWIDKVPVPQMKAVEVPKYNYIENGIWILEKLFTSNEHPEIAESFTYEPVWVFYDGAPTEKILLFVAEAAQRGPTKVLSEEEERLKSKAEYFEMLGGKASISDKIAGGEGVSIPSNYEKGS